MANARRIETGKLLIAEARRLAGIDEELDGTAGQRAFDALDEAEESINSAIGSLEQAARAVPQLRGAIDRYIVGHLKDWVSNERQPGSIPELRKRLADLEDE